MSLLQVSIPRAVIKTDKLTSNHFTAYQLLVTPHSSGEQAYSVWRRYSDFRSLQLSLREAIPGWEPVVALPWRTVLNFSNHEEESFIEERRKGLECYMQHLLSHETTHAHPLVLQFVRVSFVPQSGFEELHHGKIFVITRQKPLFAGLVDMCCRSTVVVLQNGDVLVHSPVSLDSRITDQLAAIGPVRHIIAPNIDHHEFLSEWIQAYPAASVYCAPGLSVKRPDIKFDAILSDDRVYAWSSELKHFCIRGIDTNEVVFLHEPTRTLIVADLVCGANGGVGGMLFSLISGRELRASASVHASWRPENARDLSGSIERISNWSFSTLIYSHGDASTGRSDALVNFRKAFLFLSSEPPQAASIAAFSANISNAPDEESSQFEHGL